MRNARDGIPALLAQGAGMNVGQHRDMNQIFCLAQAYQCSELQWTLQRLHHHLVVSSIHIAQWASLDQEPQIHHRLLPHIIVYRMAQTVYPKDLDQHIERRHSLHNITHHKSPITTLRAPFLRNQVTLGKLLHVQVEGMFWLPYTFVPITNKSPLIALSLKTLPAIFLPWRIVWLFTLRIFLRDNMFWSMGLML